MAPIIEVIQWQETDPSVIAYRFSPGGEIKLGAQLVVHENQWAVFFRDGKALDVFGPGRHTLSTLNLPLLTGLINLPTGGESPFRADVYFISRRVYPDLKWGTREPVVFRDAELHMVRLRAFGNYAIRVVDPTLFINTLVGTHPQYTVAQISAYLRDIVVARLNDVLGENLRTVLDLPRYYDEIGSALKFRVKEDLAKYGLELVDFFINAITPPDEVQKIIDERSGMAALGDMGNYMRFKTARAVEEAASQEGGEAGSAAGAGVGIGAGFGLGMMIPGMIGQSMQQAGQAPQVLCPQCKQAIPAESKFCPHCGQKLVATITCSKCGTELPPSARFCYNCGTPVGTSGTVACPACGQENPAGAKFCAHCGKPMTPGDQS